MDSHSAGVLSLCAGVAGLDLAVRLALGAARTVGYVENEITAVRGLVSRIDDGSLDDAPVWTNLKTFSGFPWRGRVSGIVAGYPCQPFSVAGKRGGSKDPRHLWPHVARVIREVEPAWVFLENVAGHVKLGFRAVAKELRGMGYGIEAGLFTAEEVGAPHRRQRLFVLAHSMRARPSSEHAGQSDAQRSATAVSSPSRALAYGAERGRGELRESSGGDGLTHGGCKALADAEYSERRAEYQTNGKAYGRKGSGRGGSAMADAASEGSQIGRHGQHSEAQRAAAVRDCLPLFPPGPDALDAWRSLLERFPQVEPAICGAADGAPAGLDEPRASRTDRLRALGNGVVPLAAAFAFCVLRERIETGGVTA